MYIRYKFNQAINVGKNFVQLEVDIHKSLEAEKAGGGHKMQKIYVHYLVIYLTQGEGGQI